MGLLGPSKNRLNYDKLVSTTTYARNRLLTGTPSTGKAAYASYGSVATGYTQHVNVEATDAMVAIIPLNKVDDSFFLKALTAITKGSLVFPAAEGKVVQSSYNCLAGIIAAPDAPTEDDTYMLPAAPTGTGWENHANAIAIRGSAAWSYVDVDATTNLGLTVYLTEERRYYTWNGTAWVVAKAAAIAAEAAVAGQEFVCYNTGNTQRLIVDALPAGMNFAPTLVKAVSGAGGAAAASVLDNRLLTTDRVVLHVHSVTGACYLKSAICSTAGTATITFSADPGAWTGTLVVYRL